MSKGAYIGVDGKARKIKAIYVGDASGKARKVKKGYVGVGEMARLFYQAAIPVGELEVGSEVILNVGGVPTPFIVVHQGLPEGTREAYDASCDGTWLLMKDCVKESIYNINTILTYLNDEFLRLLDADVQSAVKEVRIQQASSSSLLTTRVFIPLAGELGFTRQNDSKGGVLDYFANGGSRIAYMNGEAVYWWTRSTYASGWPYACVENNGSLNGKNNPSYSYGIRPMFILSPDYEINPVD